MDEFHSELKGNRPKKRKRCLDPKNDSSFDSTSFPPLNNSGSFPLPGSFSGDSPKLFDSFDPFEQGVDFFGKGGEYSIPSFEGGNMGGIPSPHSMNMMAPHLNMQRPINPQQTQQPQQQQQQQQEYHSHQVPQQQQKGSGKGSVRTVFSLFEEDVESARFNVQPRLKVNVEGLKYDANQMWVKKSSVVKVHAEIIGYRGEQPIVQLFENMNLCLVGCGLPQTFMSRNPYCVFQCVINPNKREDGVVVQKTPSGQQVLELVKKEMGTQTKCIFTSKIHVGTNVSGHWRYTQGYRYGIVFQNVFYMSQPFKVLSRRPAKKKQPKPKSQSQQPVPVPMQMPMQMQMQPPQQVAMPMIPPQQTVRRIPLQQQQQQQGMMKPHQNLFPVQFRNGRFLCFLYIFDQHSHRCVVEFPEMDKPNWISINESKRIGYITLTTSGLVVSSNEQNYIGSLILNNQNVQICDVINNRINVIVTLGTFTSIKIVNKPRWAIIFKDKEQIIQVAMPNQQSSIIVGRNSKYIPQELTNEEKAAISKLHLKIETSTFQGRDVLKLTDCSKNGSRVTLPLNKAIFMEGEKYEIKFREASNLMENYKFTFFYSTQVVGDGQTMDMNTDSFEKQTTELIKELKNIKIS